jgi:RecJ-like exonuclease
MSLDIHKLTKKAASIIKEAPAYTKFRVISHYDADGITAASILCKALFREGFNFHATLMRNPFTKGIDLLKEEENTHIIFTDMGSAQIPLIEDIDAQIILVDHHQLKQEKTKKHIFQINANQCGINGNYEACGATLSYSIAKELNNNNQDLISLAIAGATGDKQYIGGFKGFNKTLLEEAIQKQVVSEEIGLKLSESSIADSLYFSVEPYYQGLSGNRDAIEEFLKKLHITNQDNYQELSEEKRKNLHSFLILQLIKQGCESNIIDTVIRTRYYSEQTFGEMEQFADLLDSCGKGGHRDIGLALCLGEKKSYQIAKKHEKSFKKSLLESLRNIEKKGVQEKKSFRYFYTDHTSRGGVIGGIATNFLLDNKKPLLSIAKKPEELHISCRGNQYLVEKGLDLGIAMSSLAKKLQGHGGGHNIAAGATIPIDKEDQFLIQAEIIFSQQLGIKQE